MEKKERSEAKNEEQSDVEKVAKRVRVKEDKVKWRKWRKVKEKSRKGENEKIR